MSGGHHKALGYLLTAMVEQQASRTARPQKNKAHRAEHWPVLVCSQILSPTPAAGSHRRVQPLQRYPVQCGGGKQGHRGEVRGCCRRGPCHGHHHRDNRPAGWRHLLREDGRKTSQGTTALYLLTCMSTRQLDLRSRQELRIGSILHQYLNGANLS